MEIKIIFQLIMSLKFLFTITCSVKLSDFEIISNNVIPNGAANFSMKVKAKCKFKKFEFIVTFFNCFESNIL